MFRVKRLLWEELNIAHIARHAVKPEEVDQVCHSNPVTRDAKHGRILAIGLTKSGRMISVILDPEPEPDIYYPVTARSSSKKERRRYFEEKGHERK